MELGNGMLILQQKPSLNSDRYLRDRRHQGHASDVYGGFMILVMPAEIREKDGLHAELKSFKGRIG